MNYFDEQLNIKNKKDDERYSHSIELVANVIMGDKIVKEYSDIKVAESAIEEILNYFKIEYDFGEKKGKLNSIEEYIDYINKKYYIMHREVKLKKGFYKDAIGPMITKSKSTGDIIALIPNKFSGYTYFDYKKGVSKKVNSKNENDIDENAVVLYKSFENKKISISQFLKSMLSSLNISDILFLIFTSSMLLLFQLLLPVFAYTMLDTVLAYESYKLFYGMVILISVTMFDWFLIAISKELVYGKLIIKQSMGVESSLVARLLSLPSDFFKNFSSGELAERFAYLPLLIELLVKLVWTYGFSFIFTMIFFLYYGAFFPSAIIPMLIFYCTNVVIFIIAFRLLSKNYNKSFYITSKVNGMLYGIISGIQKIKLTGIEKRMFAKWTEKYADEVKYQYNPPLFAKIFPSFHLLVNLLAILIFYIMGIYRNLSPQEFYTLIMMYTMSTVIFIEAFNMLPQLAMIKPILNLIKPLLETVPEVNLDNTIINKLDGDIELVNVSFRYSNDTPYIINNLSLSINKGEYIGIVGKTGCGKSTLIRLLLGFEKPDSGGIYFDKKNIDKIELKSLRHNIGTIMQNDKLFTDSIFANISITNPKLTIEEGYEYLKIAGMKEDINNMPMGIFTMISDGDGGISGGQKQRLLIARALASNAKVLIFDEATSALDNITQMKISNALDSLGCTRIVIAHRLSTIKNCDRILVFDEGHIVEEGKYEDLINKNGLFAELVERQRVDIDVD